MRARSIYQTQIFPTDLNKEQAQVFYSTKSQFCIFSVIAVNVKKQYKEIQTER